MFHTAFNFKQKNDSRFFILPSFLFLFFSPRIVARVGDRKLNNRTIKMTLYGIVRSVSVCLYVLYCSSCYHFLYVNQNISWCPMLAISTTLSLSRSFLEPSVASSPVSSVNLPYIFLRRVTSVCLSLSLHNLPCI